MMDTSPPRPLHWSFLLGAALVVTLFLYFIDEGRYSLEGLFTLGNMVAMAIYFFGLVMGLFLMAQLFAKRQAGPLRTALVVSTGAIIGTIIGLGIIMGIGALQCVG
jgi:hypothetical protein